MPRATPISKSHTQSGSLFHLSFTLLEVGSQYVHNILSIALRFVLGTIEALSRAIATLAMGLGTRLCIVALGLYRSVR